MRIALAQVNPTVGDIAGNTKIIIDYARRARAAGARVVVFPELVVTGYPPRDLLLKPSFIDDSLRAVETIARETEGIDAIVGYPARNEHEVGRPLWNAAALLRGGRVVSSHFKTLLPTYDVFDESRYFEPGPAEARNILIDIDGVPVGLSICEDLWNDERLIARRLYHTNPIAQLHSAGARLMLNCSASPFVVGKHAFREELFASQVRQFGCPLVYVNQVGGNDELVFDGCSCVFDANGNVIARAKAFEEDLLIVDVPLQGDRAARVHDAEGHVRDARATVPTGIASIHRALILGLKDYMRKCGFKSAVVGLSGGIDSAVVAALAVEALGADKVTGVAMPSRYSSDHSIADAKALAANLGIAFHVIPIREPHAAFETALADVFAGRVPDVAEENIQARCRGVILMAISNKFGSILLTTGNKSEIAVGYCTLYGDMAGGLAVISDVPKTDVYRLARHLNDRAGRPIIPEGTLTKPPSAELRPNQTDQDSLPPYDVLDAILFRYVEEEKSAKQIIADGFEPAVVERVIRLIDLSEYKRRQAAPGLKVTSRAFGMGRRMPIAQRYRPGVG